MSCWITREISKWWTQFLEIVATSGVRHIPRTLVVLVAVNYKGFSTTLSHQFQWFSGLIHWTQKHLSSAYLFFIKDKSGELKALSILSLSLSSSLSFLLSQTLNLSISPPHSLPLSLPPFNSYSFSDSVLSLHIQFPFKHSQCVYQSRNSLNLWRCRISLNLWRCRRCSII